MASARALPESKNYIFISETVTPVFIKSNKTFAPLAGYMFEFDKNKLVFQVRNKLFARMGYFFRFVLQVILICLVLENLWPGNLLGECENGKFASGSKILSGFITLSINLMLLGALPLVSLYYMVRWKNSSEYIRLLNSFIQIELNLNKSNYESIKPSLKAKSAAFFIAWNLKLIVRPFICGLALWTAIDPKLPLNILNLLGDSNDFLVGTSAYFESSKIHIVAKYMLCFWRFLANFVVWGIISVSGHRIVTDILLGAATLAYIQDALKR